MFNNSVENTPEYYRNMLVLIILKGSFLLSNLRGLVHANTVASNVWYCNRTDRK